MLINELPDECLLIIFSHLNDLVDLIDCYKVCVKWSHLVAERTRKVKYLIDKDIQSTYSYCVGDPDNSVDCVYYQGEKPIDATVLTKLFESLEIVDYFKLREGAKSEDCVELVMNQESIKGLICGSDFFEESIAKYCNQLEMISSDWVGGNIGRNGYSVKQLYLWLSTLDYFKEDAHNFPNLERLHIYHNEGSPDVYYDGPIMEKLKIVELSLSSYDGQDICYSFQFMDCCPNLQSAHIIVDSDRMYVDESKKHRSLQDLVLHFLYSDRMEWNDVKRLFMKYPNLKHLALRDNLNIKDEQIEQLIKILCNLVLFDVRRCPRVTQSSANYVQDYCKRYGRSIKFYFDGNQEEIKSDWPQLSTKKEKISRGFDFMKHCFLKWFHDVPVFMIPIDH